MTDWKEEAEKAWKSPSWKEAAKEKEAKQTSAEIDVGSEAAGLDEGDMDDDGKKRPTQADVLIEIAAGVSLFHTPDKEGFADIIINGHRETHRICGSGFKRWLRHEYFKLKKSGCNSDALKVAVDTIDAKALFEGNTREVHTRIASDAGIIYIDLGDESWRAIKITKMGWELVARPPVRFQRSPSLRPLPMPVKGGSIELLRSFCNVSDSGFVLLVAFLLAAFRPQSNYPVLVLTGEQGSAKSSLTRLIVRLTDPRMPEQRSLPRSEEDLLVAAKGQHLLAFDNVSGLADWLSDAMCRLSTGGGAGKRKLYTDEDEILFSGRRIVVLNGIEDVAVRPDLVDRAILLVLEPIPEHVRRDEGEFDKAFVHVTPKVLGALLDAVAVGLRTMATITITDKPRMADFALWAEACTRKFWPEETFLGAYRENVGQAVDLSIESSDVAEAVRLFMANRDEWTGTAGELLPLLTALVAEQVKKERTWPRQANGMSNKLRRVAPPLRKVGISITFTREGHERTRTIKIVSRRVRKTSSASSSSSADDQNASKNNGRGQEGADDTRPSADDVWTMANPPPSAAKSLQTHEMDDADSADDVLRHSTVPNDYDAVIEERAAQGQPATRPPRGKGWELAGELPGAKATVWIKEVWPPSLGPPGDDIFDFDPGWPK
jgi:hypothetical protein